MGPEGPLTLDGMMRTLYFWHELEDMFEDQLNECYDTVKICGYEYAQGHALRQLDTIAFNASLHRWIDNEEYIEIRSKDMTDEEFKHNDISDTQVMWGKEE